MTKEELDRIKKAYSSGLKIQIWFNGYWEDFDIRDYTMYSDPFSENRQYRIVGSDYADIAEKHIKDLEKACDETQELLDKQIEATYKVVEKLNKAKEIIRAFVNWANWQGNSKCPSFKSIQDKAEQFLKESE